MTKANQAMITATDAITSLNSNLDQDFIKVNKNLYIPPPEQPIQKVQPYQHSDNILPNELEWSIENIYERSRLHMLCMPLQSLENIIFIRLIKDWMDGLTFLGSKCHPDRFVYIDKLTDLLSFNLSCRSIGINPSDFNFLPGVGKDESFDQMMLRIPDNVNTVFINSLAHTLSPHESGEITNSYSKVSNFLRKIKKWCLSNNKTVIFTHPTAKGDTVKYDSAKYKVFASAAWLQAICTLVTLEEEFPSDSRNPYRLINIYSQGNPSVPRSNDRYMLDFNTGRLIHSPKKEKPDFISFLVPAQSYTAVEIIKLSGIPRSSGFRKISQALSDGHLVKVQGKYILA